MFIIIAGGGKIGRSLTGQLCAEGHDVTVIEQNPDTIKRVSDTHDVMTVQGNCAAMAVLQEAGIKKADVLIAAARTDEVNLLCCLTAHALNPKIRTIARIRNPEYYEQIFELQESLSLSMTFNPELSTAREISRLLEFPGFLQRESFVKDRVQVVELLIEKSSKLCGVSLEKMSAVTGCNVLVCTVVRGGQTFMPGGDFVMQAGDHIYVTASTEELSMLLKSLGYISRKITRVLLCGGGMISYYLAGILLKAGKRVRILENDHARCMRLAQLYPDADIIEGDATNQSRLEQEAVECDAVVSLTGLDEMNIIISVFAHDLDVPHIVTKIGRTESMQLINRLGVSSAVCPQEIIGGSITRFIRALKHESSAAITVHTIASGNAEAAAFLVNDETRYRNVPLKDIPFRRNCLLACIYRHGKPEIASGRSTFDTGDTLVVVTAAETGVEQLNDIFERT